MRELHLASNGNITDAGLLHLGRMKRLEQLRLGQVSCDWSGQSGYSPPIGQLGELRRPRETLKQLEQELPSCSIHFPPYTDTDTEEEQS